MSAPTDPDVPEAVTYREITEILRTFRDSGWTGMTVDLHGMRITVGKDGPPRGAAVQPVEGPGAAVAPTDGRTLTEDRQSDPDRGGFPPRNGPDHRSPTANGSPGVAIPAGSATGTTAPPSTGDPSVDLSGCVDVRSPAVGAFWVAPSPGQPPFVDVGQPVAQDEQLAIVEVMKLMNPVVAPVSGTVVQVCAANADLVEYEQVLFRIRPSDG